MDDLEICKRIAEIDGIHVSNVEAGMYNPLTDDALCFNLMIKYSLELHPMFRGEWCASFISTYTYEEEPIYGAQGVDKNPNKAICLAIIEAHNENN